MGIPYGVQLWDVNTVMGRQMVRGCHPVCVGRLVAMEGDTITLLVLPRRSTRQQRMKLVMPNVSESVLRNRKCQP